ncbi:MAG: hypothetical protein WBN23_01570, partial [Woeseia sp.]
CASLQTTMIRFAIVALDPSLQAVSCNMVRLPIKGSSCFGYMARDAGQSRVPEPPERITG